MQVIVYFIGQGFLRCGFVMNLASQCLRYAEDPDCVEEKSLWWCLMKV